MPIDDQNRAASSPGQSFPRGGNPRFTFYDNRGNLLNVINQSGGPDGIYRTFLNSNNQNAVMVPLTRGEIKYPLGFTPPEAYYVYGSLINETTGLPKEMGDRISGVSLNNNTSNGKDIKTYLVNNQFYAVNPFTKPEMLIQNQSNTNNFGPNVSLPSEFGLSPNNRIDYYEYKRKNLTKTTPYLKVVGNSKEVGLSSSAHIVGKKQVFDAFNDNERYLFVHGISDDRLSRLSNPSTLLDDANYLASFVSTTDNEDPTMFGYDIKIIYDSSPLFNGSIVEFIDSFDDDGRNELSNRKMIWATFCKQFFKFFKYKGGGHVPKRVRDSLGLSGDDAAISGSRSSSEVDKYDNFPGVDYEDRLIVDNNKSIDWNSSGKRSIKTYYLKKISGLDKLVEGDVSNNSDSIKSMVDYGKDTIKLTLNEDVSVNTGYLASLYKMLSWSRINGRQIIPENLLRFDAQITITEIRNYNRVVMNPERNSYSILSDNTSKYVYNLYDCQFIFDKLSHGDEIDMSSPSLSQGYDISFNYKYTTMKFEKFSYVGPSASYLKSEIDNESGGYSSAIPYSTERVRGIKYDEIYKEETNYNSVESKQIPKEKYYIPEVDTWKVSSQTVENTLDSAERNNRGREMLQNLERGLRRAAVGEINRRILTQARLLNRTLDNIRNSIGLGRMSAPTNVYEGDFFRNDVTNAFRDFIGQSVRGFFDSNL